MSRKNYLVYQQLAVFFCGKSSHNLFGFECDRCYWFYFSTDQWVLLCDYAKRMPLYSIGSAIPETR